MIRIARARWISGLVALVVAAGRVAGGERPDQVGAGDSPNFTETGVPVEAGHPSDAMSASPNVPSYWVVPTTAKPYMTVTFRYNFPTSGTPSDGPFFMHCSREDQPDNEAGLLGYKDLNTDWHDGWIRGEYTGMIPWDPSLYGNYSFRVFGPVRIMGGQSGLFGAQRLDHIEHQKILTEGRFTVGPYEPALTVEAQTPPRRWITIRWQGASVHPHAWIGLFKREAGDGYPLLRRSFANLGSTSDTTGSSGVWQVEAPAELGEYDVRTFIDLGYDRIGLQFFSVTWGTSTPAISGFPASCYPMVSMPVSYVNAPPEINARIGIHDATNTGSDTRWSWRSLQGRTSGDLVFTAPELDGRYDIRMYDSEDNLLARSSPFDVVHGSDSIQLAATVSSGRVVLTWNNPVDYQRLAGYYLYRGTAEGQESSTPLTTGHLPVDRSAGASTQTNTYVDIGLQPGVAYYYVLRPLAYDLKTLGAPSNEVTASVPSVDSSTTGSSSPSPDGATVSGGSSETSPAASSPNLRPPVSAAAGEIRPVVRDPVPPTGPGGASMETTGHQGGGTAGVSTPGARGPTDTMAGTVGGIAAGEVPGAWAEAGRVYRLGETDPIQFSLQAAEYEARRLQFGNAVFWPKAGEKFLVVHFQLSNSQQQAIRVVAARFDWSVAPAAGAPIARCEYIGHESGAATFDHTLEAGKSSRCLAVFRVPGAGEMQSLTVTNRRDLAAATARYDLRDRVRALPGAVADPRDATGASVVDAVVARPGELFSSGVTDVVVQSVEVVGADAPVPAGRNPNLPVYATVRYTFQGPFAPVFFGGRAPVVTLIDSQGGARAAENQTYALRSPEIQPLRPKAGDTVEFRLRFWIPRGTMPQRLVFRDPGGIPVHVALGSR